MSETPDRVIGIPILAVANFEEGSIFLQHDSYYTTMFGSPGPDFSYATTTSCNIQFALDGSRYHVRFKCSFQFRRSFPFRDVVFVYVFVCVCVFVLRLCQHACFSFECSFSSACSFACSFIVYDLLARLFSFTLSLVCWCRLRCRLCAFDFGVDFNFVFDFVLVLRVRLRVAFTFRVEHSRVAFTCHVLRLRLRFTILYIFTSKDLIPRLTC